MIKDERLLKVEEVATTVGLSRACIWRWAARGRFPQPIRLGNKTTRWKRSDVEAWIAAAEKAEPRRP
jgi:excisionase family DNA binding protein